MLIIDYKITDNFKVISMVLMLLLTSTCLFAQTQIRGTVRDAKTNEPMPGVNIIIKELTDGASTDDNGKYSISVPYGNYKIEFSFISYETKEKTINCNKPQIIINATLNKLSLKLGEVVVTAKSKARQIREQAMPISVITMKELQGTVSNVGDILSKTSGAKIRNTGGVGSASRISVRGLEGKRIGFFVDETPLNDNSDFVDINDIPVDLIERIEVYKGIVPAKFGGSAIGGAVNIVIKEYPENYLDAGYTLQSFNTHKANTVFKHNRNGIGISLGGAYTYSDNNYKMELPLRPGEFRMRDHDKFKKLLVAASLTSKKWWFDEMKIEPVLIISEKEIQGIEENIQHAVSYSDAFALVNEYEKSNFPAEGLDFDFDQSYAYTVYSFIDTSRYTYNWDGSIKDTVFNEIAGVGEGETGEQPSDAIIKKHQYFQKLNMNYVINEKNSINLNSMYRYVKGLPEDELKDMVVGYKTSYNSKMNSWVMGLTYEFNSLDKKFTNALNGKYYHYSMQTKLVDLTGFDRTPDDVNNTRSDFGASNAMRYRFTPQFLVKASFAYDIRLPTDEELLGDGFLIAPAGNLIPERNTSFNLGFMYDIVNKSENRFQLEINVFYMYLKDMIRFTGGALQSKYQNFGEMRTLGAEIEVKTDATSWLYLWGNATYQDLRDTRKYEASSTTPNPTYEYRMPNVPYLFANAGLELHKENLFGGTGQNSRLFADCSFVEEYFYDFEVSKYQERKIPRAIIFNAGLEHSLHNQSIFISIQANNIFDEKVFSEFNRPLPGRNFGMKMRYVWK